MSSVGKNATTPESCSARLSVDRSFYDAINLSVDAAFRQVFVITTLHGARSVILSGWGKK